MIYFVCPDMSTPSGGIKMIYNFVEMLNNNGFQASVLHRNNVENGWSGKPTWFKFDETKVPIVYTYVNKVPTPLTLLPTDVLVIPEGMGTDIITKYKKPNCKKVVFAQSWSYILPTFGNIEQNQDIFTQLAPRNWKTGGFTDVIVTSDVIDGFVKTVFKYDESSVHRVSPFLNHDLFNNVFSLGEFKMDITLPEKEKTILFCPRKHPDRYQTAMFYLVHAMPELLKEWQFKPIDNVSQEESSEALKRSAIFLHLSPEEGFGLFVAEAMACNSLAVGHTGLGASEFFNTEFTDNTNTIWGTVDKLIKAIKLVNDQDEEKWNVITSNQRDRVLGYNEKNTEKQLIEAFKKIVEKP